MNFLPFFLYPKYPAVSAVSAVSTAVSKQKQFRKSFL